MLLMNTWCVSSPWCVTVYQLYWIILTEIIFLFSKNTIHFKICYTDYTITLNYRQVCSNVYQHSDFSTISLAISSSKAPFIIPLLKQQLVDSRSGLSSFVKRTLNFPKTRFNMNVAVDRVWQKRCFDCHTNEYMTCMTER